MDENYTVTPGDTLNEVPTDNKKALASGAVATVVTFLTSLQIAMSGGVTGEEWVGIALGTVIGAAAGFGITYATPTKVK